MTAPYRNTLFEESATVVAQQPYPGEQYILTLEAPETAARALPGSFVHLRCDPLLPMRRPLSILRAHPDQGRIDLLYKALGYGTRLLARRQPGERLELLGPIGRPFQPDPERPRALLIGGGVGIPPMVFLAEHFHQAGGAWRPVLLMGSEVPFPFRPQPSKILMPTMPAGVIAAMPLAEDWGIPSRLASLQGYPGCHEGYVTDLARAWLDGLDTAQRDEVALYACGPHPMLAAVAQVARDYDLPCQVSLEEYMACAVGGCAGCVVRVEEPGGPTMQRVCVDGPVFDAYRVFPAV